MQHGVRDRADAQLERRAVDHQVGDVAGDPLRQLVGLAALERLQEPLEARAGPRGATSSGAPTSRQLVAFTTGTSSVAML